MTSMTPENYIHLEFPKRFARTEFWKQIKRTVGGDPVSDRDIAQIVSQITSQLSLRGEDHLLDLGCGNGALAGELFHCVAKYTGVDFSEYLLGIAKEHFPGGDHVRYLCADIRDTGAYLPVAADSTKVLIYGCIGYLRRNEVADLLSLLRQELPHLRTVMIGNIADQQHADEFFAARKIGDYSLDDPQTPIGVWWHQNDLLELARRCGYSANCLKMPDEFYASRYRFDLVLQVPR